VAYLRGAREKRTGKGTGMGERKGSGRGIRPLSEISNTTLAMMTYLTQICGGV